jgi:hypothetical protein
VLARSLELWKSYSQQIGHLNKNVHLLKQKNCMQPQKKLGKSNVFAGIYLTKTNTLVK